MKKFTVLLLVALSLTLIATLPAAAQTGSGAPSGQHFTLNIIGVDNPKTAPMDNSNRHTIFVPLNGKCGIGLTQTPRTLDSGWDGTYETSDFAVLDGNCFDKGLTMPPGTEGYSGGGGLSAGFQLPPPDPNATGTLQYTVFVKVTSPKGSANMTTCFYDASQLATYCSTSMTLVLDKTTYGKFTNVSKSLLTVCDYTTGKLQPLFYDGATSQDQYWWEYDNQGLRHAQFRFYPKVPDSSPYANTSCTATTPVTTP